MNTDDIYQLSGTDYRNHTLTIITEHSDNKDARVVDTVFTCTAGPEEPCRNYHVCPTMEHENFADCIHDGIMPYQSGQECWLQPWFDESCATYTGDGFDEHNKNGVPTIDKTGHIVVDYADDAGPEWHFLDDEEHI